MSSSTILAGGGDCASVAQPPSGSQSQKIVPPLEFSTEHLHLRRLRPSDADEYFSFSSCSEVTRYLPWRTHQKIDEAAVDIERYREGEMENRFTWAVTLLGAGCVVGIVGCEVRDGGIGVGYILHRDVWGRGYAVEAVNMLLSWAGQRPELAVAWAVCDVENVSSRKVLSKVGLSDSGVPWLISCPNLQQEARKGCLYAKMLRPLVAG